MANLTVTVQDDVIRRARIRAIERGTSVNALVAEYLRQLAGPDPTADAVTAFLQLADASQAGSGGAGHTWTRDELHERSSVR